MTKEMLSENYKKSHAEIRKFIYANTKILTDFEQHLCVNSVGIGRGFRNKLESSIVIYLSRFPSNEKELTDLVNISQKIPHDIPIRFCVVGETVPAESL